jgi:hypothetical protein
MAFMRHLLTSILLLAPAAIMLIYGYIHEATRLEGFGFPLRPE